MKFKNNIIKWNLEKYNCTNKLYYKYQIQLFMENANTHLISTFKDYLFYDDFSEFFTKYYSKKESFDLLIPLFIYYQKSSYIFPNYTILREGKYIYKNIIQKQLLIDYLEDIEIQKKKNLICLNNKQFINNKNEKIFDTQLYNNIIMNKNNSNINLLFGIDTIPNSIPISKKNSKNNSQNYIENDSIISLKKLIKIINDSYTKSIGTNTEITFNKKKLKNFNKRKISPKEMSNSTNYLSNVSNMNINSMFKLDKKLFNNNYYLNNTNFFNNKYVANNFLEKNNIINDSVNSNYFTQKNLKANKKLNKINTQKKINSFLINFNSSFMKSFLKKKEKKKISDKNVFNTIKSKNRNMNINIKSISNIGKKRHVLTPIQKMKHHISICSSIGKETKINRYLTHLPSIDNCSRINLKYKKIKVINNKTKKNTLYNNHSQIKSKFDRRLLENKNKRVLINNNYNHQRNKKINIEYNIYLNNPKKNNENASLNNSIYKTINMNNKKNSMRPFTQYRKDKRISLCNELFKNEFNSKPKKKFCSKNISKRRMTPINNEEEKKKNSVKIISSYINTKLPTPKKTKGDLLLKHRLYFLFPKNKNKSLINTYKTMHNSKYFSKKSSHVIIIKKKK